MFLIQSGNRKSRETSVIQFHEQWVHLQPFLDEVRGLAAGRRGDPADPAHAVQVVGHVQREVVVDDVHRVAGVDSAGCLAGNSTLKRNRW